MSKIDRVKLTKFLRDFVPGVLSVESLAGVTYASAVSEVERLAHEEATSISYFKQRQAYHRDKKHKEHEEAIKAPRHIQPHKRQAQISDDL